MENLKSACWLESPLSYIL